MRTPFEIRDNYEKARHDVTYLKRLDEYDLNRVSEYAEKEWMSCVQHAANFMDMMGEQLYYPEEYRNGREVEYILERNMVNAQECQRVRNEIRRLRALQVATPVRLSNAQALIIPQNEQSSIELTQAQINNHMSRLAQKQVGGLPAWELLDKLIDVQKTYYSPDRREYITKLYYAIKDLLSVDYYCYLKTVAIDEANYTVTKVYERNYPNRVGTPETGTPHTSSISQDCFRTEYAGKTLEQLNQNIKATRSTKLDKYGVLQPDEKNSVSWLVENIIDEGESIERKIDKLFEPVIYSGWDKITFEEFVEKYQPAPAPSTLPASYKLKTTRSNSTPGFDTYIVEEHRAMLMPYLIENYTGKMPRKIVPMIYALESLGKLKWNVDQSVQTDLIGALQTTFGNQLKDSALKTALLGYDPKSKQPDLAKQQKIDQQKQAIEILLKHK
ncbi:hypothetical protein GCM10027341_46200 [Spirosoma knui]